jgi:hypothetical protein
MKAAIQLKLGSVFRIVQKKPFGLPSDDNERKIKKI